MADTWFKYIGRGTEKLAPHGELVQPGVPFESPELYILEYENCAVYEKCDPPDTPAASKTRRAKPPAVPKDGDEE